MRQSRETKAETHQAIVAEASRMFRERGVEGASVAEVMKAARKTHGGFYRHFDSKESLLVAALEDAFAAMARDIDAAFADVPRSQALATFVAGYLSPERVADVGGGCPVAALSGDVMRSTDTVRKVFGKGARQIIETLADKLDGPRDLRKLRAAQAFAMAAGALMIARASDAETAELVLGAAVAADGAGLAGQVD